jgi:hypothetical protein
MENNDMSPPPPAAPRSAPAQARTAVRRTGPNDDRDRLIKGAAASDKLFLLGTVKAMKEFHLDHSGIREAMRLARQTRDPAAIDRLLAGNDARRTERRVMMAETRYPGVHRRIQMGESAGTAADHYHLTRQRVHQLYHQLVEVAAYHRKTPSAYIDQLEESVAKLRAARRR